MINTTWKIVFAILALCFDAGIILYLLLYGHPENLLHQNALSWSYITGAGVLAGVGFGQIVEFLPKGK